MQKGQAQAHPGRAWPILLRGRGPTRNERSCSSCPWHVTRVYGGGDPAVSDTATGGACRRRLACLQPVLKIQRIQTAILTLTKETARSRRGVTGACLIYLQCRRTLAQQLLLPLKALHLPHPQEAGDCGGDEQYPPRPAPCRLRRLQEKHVCNDASNMLLSLCCSLHTHSLCTTNTVRTSADADDAAGKAPAAGRAALENACLTHGH